LVHRRDRFWAHETSLSTLREMVKTKKIILHVPIQLTDLVVDKKSLRTVQIEDFDGNRKDLNVDVLLACYGLSQKLGPVSDWGLEIENRRIETNPTTAQTNQLGVFAVGDIAVYPQKQRLILTGFSEATFAAEAAYRHINSGASPKFQHSTSKGLPHYD